MGKKTPTYTGVLWSHTPFPSVHRVMKSREGVSCAELQRPTCLHGRMKGRRQKDRVPVPMSQLHALALPFTMKTALYHAMLRAKGH